MIKSLFAFIAVTLSIFFISTSLQAEVLGSDDGIEIKNVRELYKNEPYRGHLFHMTICL